MFAEILQTTYTTILSFKILKVIVTLLITVTTLTNYPSSYLYVHWHVKKGEYPRYWPLSVFLSLSLFPSDKISL